jgi:hypothetical protein
MSTIPTLPGVRVSLSDSYYSANDVNPDAKRMLVIAGATGANHYNPVQYFSEVAVIAACGLGSDAHIAYVQALRSGATNVFLATVDSAACATAVGREAELVKALSFADMCEPDYIVPFGFYANELVPGTGSAVTKNISAAPAGTAGDLQVTITTTTAHGFAEGDVVALTGLTPAFLNGASRVITEIISPTKFTVWAKEADHAYALVAGDVSALASTGATAVKDTVTGTRISANAVNLGTACHKMYRDLNPCLGIMGLVPIAWNTADHDLPTATEIAAYETAVNKAAVVNYAAETFAPYANVISAIKSVVVDGDTVDLGKYMAPSIGKVILRGQVASEATSKIEFVGGEVATAGQVYSTPLEDSITSSPMTNVISISNNFSRAQKLALVGSHLNPICLSSGGTIVTLDGWTMASPDVDGNPSVYERLSTVCIVNSVVKDTRNVLEKFIGMQASTARLNSIETALRTVYTAYKVAGVLKNAEFKIEYNQTTGTLKVDLNLVPFGEMREIVVTVAVKINA